MPSTTLYPPIVNDYMPAFQVDPGVVTYPDQDNACPIDFAISKFNLPSEIKQIQVTITKQNTGANVLNLHDKIESGQYDPNPYQPLPADECRYRSTGILLIDLPSDGLTPSADGIYTINLYDTDLDCQYEGTSGFIPGWIYKVQMRFSSVRYYEDRDTYTQATWLKNNASSFSEWSTVCVVKPIGTMELNVTHLITNNNPSGDNLSYPSSNLEIFGSLTSVYDETEILYSYNIYLYDAYNNLLEESGKIIASNYVDINKLHYIFGYELQNNVTYGLRIEYVTNNNFTDSVFVDFRCRFDEGTLQDISVLYLESSAATNPILNLTSIGYEEDEGRIGLLLNKATDTTYTGKIFIRRTDSTSNFTKWIDLKEINCNATDISTIGLFYDYTVESGIWYKYAVQTLSPGDDFRSRLVYPEDEHGDPCDEDYAMRDFNYSFLLGQNEQQLKLKFDNTMGSFKYQVSDSKIETVGGQYPTIARNTAVYYRFFPINGLISFQMDENQAFCTKEDIYQYEKVRALYDKYKSDRGVSQYDYVYERQFRDKVMAFLLDGRPKLFKSPTEGNIIVRLMDVNLSPNQSLDRMVYSFSCNGNELAENNFDNRIKYKVANLTYIKPENAADLGHVHTTGDANYSPYPNQAIRPW